MAWFTDGFGVAFSIPLLCKCTHAQSFLPTPLHTSFYHPHTCVHKAKKIKCSREGKGDLMTCDLSTHSEVKSSQNATPTLLEISPCSDHPGLKEEEPWGCCEPPAPALRFGVEDGVCSRQWSFAKRLVVPQPCPLLYVHMWHTAYSTS